MLTDYQLFLEGQYNAQLKSARETRRAIEKTRREYSVQGVYARLNYEVTGDERDYEYFEKADRFVIDLGERLEQWNQFIEWLETAPVEDVIEWLDNALNVQQIRGIA